MEWASQLYEGHAISLEGELCLTTSIKSAKSTRQSAYLYFVIQLSLLLQSGKLLTDVNSFTSGWHHILYSICFLMWLHIFLIVMFSLQSLQLASAVPDFFSCTWR
jgi:hypothetical protein